MHTQDHQIDLARYFARIGYNSQPDVSARTLRELHLAHTTSVPFENLDVLLGRTIRLDLPSVEEKLVAERRGGYCFQQNALFAAVLEQIGFPVTRLSARVKFGTDRVLPRTHMLLKVKADGRSWMTDVGFGGWGLLEPVPLEESHDLRQGVWKFSLTRTGDWWLFQCPQSLFGPDQYTFNLEPHLPVDYEPANHYCATYPESRFVQTLTAQIPSLTQRLLLKNRELMTITPEGMTTEELPNEAALLEVLRTRFGIDLPAGTSFGPTRQA
jgi:N-hydroxyarylamine O-acetyltransferase